MTIVEYLIGKAGFYVSEDQILSILIDREVNPEDDCLIVDCETRNLLYADLLFLKIVSPDNSFSQDKSHGDYSEKISYSSGNVDNLIELAYSIYNKYNDPKALILLDKRANKQGIGWVNEPLLA